MADIEHPTITDPLIHEPKGISTAAANRVYLSDGVGSGSWSRVPPTALTDSVTAFGSQILQVQLIGTQTYPTSETWTNVLLNTVVQNDISASLNTNTITLPSGTYIVDGVVMGQAGAYQNATVNMRSRLYNSTTSSAILDGTYDAVAGISDSTPVVVFTKSFLKGRFVLNNTANINVQMNLKHNNAGGFATSQLLHNLMFWKIA